VNQFRVYVCAPGKKDGANWVLVCRPPSGLGLRTKRVTSGTPDRAQADRLAEARQAELNSRPVYPPDPW
jgi:hypothetical protein